MLQERIRIEMETQRRHYTWLPRDTDVCEVHEGDDVPSGQRGQKRQKTKPALLGDCLY